MKNKTNKINTKKFERESFDEFDDVDFPAVKETSRSELDKLLADEERDSSNPLAVGKKVECELVVVAGEEVFFSIRSNSSRPRDGVLPKKELLDASGNFTHKAKDVLSLYVTKTKGHLITLSTSPLAKSKAEGLSDAYKSGLPIEGKISEVCNGGVRVEIQGKTAFCPMGQIDIVRVDNAASYIGQKHNFLITKISEGGRNIVVSRRKLLENDRDLSEKVFLKEKKEGDIVSGKVKRIEAYGAFVEIAPAIEGLVHISEISWTRINHPQEALSIGQNVSAKILKSEQKEGKLKISLSMKQAENEPWGNISEKFKIGQVVEGKVTRCLNFGAFVEIAYGIEGLVPLSEMSHTKRVMRSNEFFKENDKIVVVIKEINPDAKKMVLSYRDASTDPWALVSQKFPVGTVVKGTVNRREPYGIFVEIEDGITGLLPKSSTIDNSEFHYEKIKLSDVITVEVAEINIQDRRISLTPPQDPEKHAWKEHVSKMASSNEFKGTLASKFKNISLKK